MGSARELPRRPWVGAFRMGHGTGALLISDAHALSCSPAAGSIETNGHGAPGDVSLAQPERLGQHQPGQ